jgi:hypothetical protein
VTAVVLGVVVVITLLNLVLLLGVVRRLREHETRLATLREGAGGPPELIAAVGSRVGSFSARSVAGTLVDNATLPTPALVGFFSPGCDACHERLPDFRQAAGDHPGRALAVVIEDGLDPASLVADLDGSATVVLEPPGGPLMEAFGVQGFPVFALVGSDGTIQARGYDLPLQPA